MDLSKEQVFKNQARFKDVAQIRKYVLGEQLVLNHIQSLGKKVPYSLRQMV